MDRRLRIVLLILALMAGIAALAHLSGWLDRSTAIGMTGQPCTPEGGTVSTGGHGDWAGLCQYRADNAKLVAAGIRPGAVLIGDSLTQAWPGLDDLQGHGPLIARGIGGQTSAQVLLRFQQDAVALRPRIIHILVGTNDIAGNTGPNSPDMYQANIRAMVAMAQAEDIKVVLGTVPPARDFYWRPEVQPGDWVQILNRWITGFAAEQGIPLADYHAVLAAPGGGINPELYADGAHPNAAGYRAMQPILLRALGAAQAKGEGSGN